MNRIGRKACVLLPLLCCHLAFAAPSMERFSFTEPHMGTLVRITLFAPDEPSAAAAAAAAFARVSELNATLSDYDPDSELNRLSTYPAGTEIEVSDDLFQALERALEFSRMTGGAFDPTLGPVTRLWREARREGKPPAAEAITEARARTGYRNLRIDRERRTVALLLPEMQLDLGGIGKGFVADEALKTLREHGISSALVAAAGDIAIGSPPPDSSGWRIAISHAPSGANDFSFKPLVLANVGISTSGDAEQFLEAEGARFSHILYPASGIGLQRRIGATVIASDATTADALATAVGVIGVEKSLLLLESLARIEGMIIEEIPDKPRIEYTSGFPQR